MCRCIELYRFCRKSAHVSKLIKIDADFYVDDGKIDVHIGGKVYAIWNAVYRTTRYLIIPNQIY